MKPVEPTRTIYPSLPDIMDEETLALVTTLAPSERAFALQAPRPRPKYLRALYLKAMAYLGHSRYMPGDLPRLLRLRMAQELDLSREFADILKIHPVEKSRIVSPVRRFLGIKPYDRRARVKATAWLKEGITRIESDLLIVVNEAIRWFRDQGIELPPFRVAAAIAETALAATDRDLQNRMGNAFGAEQAENLETLLIEREGRTPFDRFKDAVRKPSSVTLQTELERLKALTGCLRQLPLPQSASRRKVEHFAEIGARHTASELRQLNPARRMTILYCYLTVRRARLLDAAAEAFLQVWRSTRSTAKNHANEYREARADIQAEYESVLQDLLDFICDTHSDHDLVHQIRKYRTQEEYETLRGEVRRTISWNECYHRKIQDHYTTLRRFLPDWYETVPMVTTTASDAILKAIAFITMHGDARQSTLPPAEIPTDFLSAKWKRRALVTHSWEARITKVHKAPYELGTVEAIAGGLKAGTLAIEGARRYAPMTQHLIDRKDFLSNYTRHLARLNCPAKAADYYHPLREKLAESLNHFDRNYEKVKPTFRVTRSGRLSYLKSSPRKPKKRIETLTRTLQAYMMPATILEVLLDCHRLTGFLDLFRPWRRRQNMSEEERIRGMLATLYAYGCNCGPTQASQATGLSKQAIVYFRRHYMGTRQLMEASSLLVDAYTRTGPSRYLEDPGIFMTDSMHFPTLEDSLSARHYFRNRSGKNILLYQHVAADCICLFTQALLCGVSEAIQMLRGAINQKTGHDASVNICDNAGRSDLVLGMAPFLNIEIWSRLSNRQNLKLWRGAKDWTYTNINRAFAGTIRWDVADAGWQDMMWVLASIADGRADPSLIAEYLRSRPQHPATKGFSELGKVFRTLYMVRYGMDMSLRRIVLRYTARRETWNQFGRNIFHGFGGLVREKDPEGQEEIFWFLTVVQNAIVLWNALALDQAIPKARHDGISIRDEDLRHILPTIIEHINFVGQFDIDMNRRPPFRLAI